MFEYILQTVETRLPQTMEQSHLQFLEIQKLVLLQPKLVNLVMISTVVQLTYLVMWMVLGVHHLLFVL